MWLRESWQKAALRFSKPCCLSSILKCLICMQSATVWKISSVNCLQSASKSQGHRKEFDHMATTIICQLLWTAFELSYGWWPWRSVCAHHLHMRTHTNLQKPLWFSEYRFLVCTLWLLNTQIHTGAICTSEFLASISGTHVWNGVPHIQERTFMFAPKSKPQQTQQFLMPI